MYSGRQSRPHLFHVVRKVCTKSGHVSTIPSAVKNNSHHGISTIKSDYPKKPVTVVRWRAVGCRLSALGRGLAELERLRALRRVLVRGEPLVDDVLAPKQAAGEALALRDDALRDPTVYGARRLPAKVLADLFLLNHPSIEIPPVLLPFSPVRSPPRSVRPCS